MVGDQSHPGLNLSVNELPVGLLSLSVDKTLVSPNSCGTQRRKLILPLKGCRLLAVVIKHRLMVCKLV